jgi:hypothetical protein
MGKSLLICLDEENPSSGGGGHRVVQREESSVLRQKVQDKLKVCFHYIIVQH